MNRIYNKSHLNKSLEIENALLDALEKRIFRLEKELMEKSKNPSSTNFDNRLIDFNALNVKIIENDLKDSKKKYNEIKISNEHTKKQLENTNNYLKEGCLSNIIVLAILSAFVLIAVFISQCS